MERSFFVKNKTYRKTFLIIILGLLLSSCFSISDIPKYEDSIVKFTDNLLHENYEETMNYISTKSSLSTTNNLDSVKPELSNFRTLLIDNFGTELQYSLLKVSKTRSTISLNDTPEGTSEVLLEFKNKEYFGILKVLVDDASFKIISIEMLNVKEPIPSMTLFWCFSFIVLIVPIFNIYMIYRIVKSPLRKKWIKYISILFFNVPTITFSPINGFSFYFLQFQLLLGVKFSLMGYMYSSCAIGLPLGAIYWFWRLSERKRLKDDTEADFSETRVSLIENKENI